MNDDVQFQWTAPDEGKHGILAASHTREKSIFCCADLWGGLLQLALSGVFDFSPTSCLLQKDRSAGGKTPIQSIRERDMEFTSGFLLSLSLCLDIGVANIAMITLAMQRGYLQGFWLGLGTCFGDLFYAVLALAGMTVLLQYEGVRWALWLGGSVLLIGFAVKMLMAAMSSHTALAIPSDVANRSYFKDFSRGVLLAVSSPTAILWFAAVGGTLISRAGGHGTLSTGLFLSGFFSAGVAWCAFICFAASHGGRLLGDRLLKYSYWISAAIFCYFAVYVILSGYHEFIGAGSAQ
jgi:L-lysine exporter family protein LysE/ArgO